MLLHYQLEGPDTAPMLVLSHSLGTSLETWEAQIPALTRHFRVLRYDSRGHGRSPVPAGPYSMDDLTQDVVDLLDRLGVARTHFCGISMGGTVGLSLALHHPQRVDRLVAANTAARFGQPQAWNDRIAQVREHGLDAIIPALLQRWFTPAFQERPEVAQVRSILSRTSPEGYAACCAAVRDVDLASKLGSMSTPTLVIGGSRDPGQSEALSLSNSMAGALYVELEAAHLSSVECPDAFGAAVSDFLLA